MSNIEYLDINGLQAFKQEEDKLLSQKQDTITDLDAIRSGATAGATAGLKILTLPQANASLSDEDMVIWNTVPHQNIAFIVPDQWSVKDWGYVQGGVLYYTGARSDGTLVYNYLRSAPYGVHISADISEEGFVITRTGVKIHDSDKQNTLVSGTNIKTINGNSILGEGNLTIDTVTEARVQEMIDASINSAIGGKY